MQPEPGKRSVKCDKRIAAPGREVELFLSLSLLLPSILKIRSTDLVPCSVFLLFLTPDNRTLQADTEDTAALWVPPTWGR